MIIPLLDLEISVLSWGYPPIAQATDDHDLVLKPMVTTGDPLDSVESQALFWGLTTSRKLGQILVIPVKLPGAEDGSSYL